MFLLLLTLGVRILRFGVPWPDVFIPPPSFHCWEPSPARILSPLEYYWSQRNFQPPEGTQLALVLRVIDGDTLDVVPIPARYGRARDPQAERVINGCIWALAQGLVPGEVLRLRLALVEAPEIWTPGGERAAFLLKSRLRPGDVVAFVGVAQDKYKRIVAWVWRVRWWGDAGLVNLWEVYQGMAIPRIYPVRRGTMLEEGLFLYFCQLAQRYEYLCNALGVIPSPYPWP